MPLEKSGPTTNLAAATAATPTTSATAKPLAGGILRKLTVEEKIALYFVEKGFYTIAFEAAKKSKLVLEEIP